jgi:hypothetical protein
LEVYGVAWALLQWFNIRNIYNKKYSNDIISTHIVKDKMKLISAKNPKWIDAEHTRIDVIALFDRIPEEIPFTADPNDCEAHGRDIFAKAVAGEFGPVEEYEPPPPPTYEEQSAIVREQRDRLLTETDWTQAADIPQATKDKWAPYRQALRDVPDQAGFPFDVVWPVKP